MSSLSRELISPDEKDKIISEEIPDTDKYKKLKRLGRFLFD